MTKCLDLKSFPIIVGVTGHRNIMPASEEPVRSAVHNALKALQKSLGKQIVLMTALAEGADQLAMEIACELGIAVIVAIPMPMDNYRTTMSSATAQVTLDRLWNSPQVALRIELPTVSGVTSAQQEQAQYEQLAVLLSRQSHILLALWNGDDPEPLLKRGGAPRTFPGGTAHVVALRTQGERGEVSPGLVEGSDLFDRLMPQLETARSGPVLHIVTPRAKDPGGVCQAADGQACSAGSLRWWSDLPAKQASDRTHRLAAALWPSEENDRHSPLAWQAVDASDLSSVMPAAFTRIAEAEALLDQHKAARSYLTNSGKPPDASMGLARLQAMFDAADGDASAVQEKLLGNWLPGLPWPKRRLKVGALLWFAMAVPVAAFCFEMFTEFERHWVWLALYVVALLAPLSIYGLLVIRHGWQARYQDHRTLAEGLRVQYFWAEAGVPVAVSESYLRHHSGLLGWIRLALRGPAIFGIDAALSRKPNPEFTIKNWIEDQSSYYAREARKQSVASLWMKRLSRLTIVALILVALATFAIVAANHGHVPDTHPAWIGEIPFVLLGTLPAVAAFFIIISEGRAYEEHAHAYSQANAVFDEALRQSHSLAVDDAQGWRKLLLALGQESLTENAAWIATHRSRPVSNRVG